MPDIRCPALARWRAVPLAALVMLIGIAPAAAQPAHDPDWPCIQRLVPELSAGMLWGQASPSVPDGEWHQDAELAQLVGEVAARRTSIEQAREAIAEYAEALPPDARAEKLGALFEGVLELVNDERRRTIDGIKHYARNQRQLAERIAQENRRLDQLEREQTSEAQAEAAELRADRDWALRIYDDRTRVLRQVCDQPVQLEQRAFALAREIQSHIE